MKIKLATEKEWTEAILDDDCEFSKFYAVADLVSNDLNITFSNQLNDFDTLYWDFSYKGHDLVLHYTIYSGISIFPKALESATPADNELVVEISTLLFQKISDLDWADFDQGKTIGTKGSESGTIIIDIENSQGARICLEKECGNIPFAITLGIYGLLFHTHFESDSEAAKEYVIASKFKINKILDLYDVPEEKHNEFWQEKQNKLIQELVAINESPVTPKKTIANSPLPKVKRSWWQKLFGPADA